MIQLGVGVIKGTDLEVRYIPKQNVEDDASIELFGIGGMHDITQWLPGEKLFPVGLSIFAGYTQLKTEIFLDKDAGQSMQLQADSFMGQVIVSKDILVFTPYVGLGYASAKVRSDVGRYETEDEVLVDPIQFNYDDGGFRGNVGLMIQLAVVTISGEYAFQEYDTYSVGFGLELDNY